LGQSFIATAFRNPLRERGINMKFAICNETFGDWPIEQGFELARKHGYTGIEVAPFTLGLQASDVSKQQRFEYASKAKAFDLEVIGLHWLLAKTNGFHLTTNDTEVRNATRNYLIELVHLCADLGGQVMVLGSPLQRNFPPSMTHLQASDNAISLLAEVVPTLEQLNVRIAVEPLGPQEGNFLNHAWQARDLIEKLGSKHVQLHLDVKAMSSEGESIGHIIEQNADLLIHFHANDPNKLGPGMGDVDQKPIFGALQRVAYNGWVSVEVFDYALGPERILCESMSNMRDALGI
jgi:sugar phosphate isomerase/epimerase